jgi:hypothetical protein
MSFMKRLFYLFLMLVLATSCLTDDDFYVKRTDRVAITTFSMPDTSSVADTIQIRATATANNGCWKELFFVYSEKADTLHAIAAYGTFESTGSCPQDTVRKDTVIDFKPPRAGDYYFYIVRDPFTAEYDTLVVE